MKKPALGEAYTLHSQLGSNSTKQKPKLTGLIGSPKELSDIRVLLAKHKVGIPFNTNVLRIALNMQEEELASVLVS